MIQQRELSLRLQRVEERPDSPRRTHPLQTAAAMSRSPAALLSFVVDNLGLQRKLVSVFDWLLGRRTKPSAKRQVHCEQHGASGPAFVCRHARHGSGLGFFVANFPNPDDPVVGDFEGCPMGWCEQCEQKRLECGGWNDESEAFSGVTLVCVRCFEKICQRNTTGKEAP
jgi:hypothetical protein